MRGLLTNDRAVHLSPGSKLAATFGLELRPRFGAASGKRRAARQQAGFVDRYDEHPKRPFTWHLADRREALLDEGGKQEHADMSVSRNSHL